MNLLTSMNLFSKKRQDKKSNNIDLLNSQFNKVNLSTLGKDVISFKAKAFTIDPVKFINCKPKTLTYKVEEDLKRTYYYNMVNPQIVRLFFKGK